MRKTYCYISKNYVVCRWARGRSWPALLGNLWFSYEWSLFVIGNCLVIDVRISVVSHVFICLVIWMDGPTRRRKISELLWSVHLWWSPSCLLVDRNFPQQQAKVNCLFCTTSHQHPHTHCKLFCNTACLHKIWKVFDVVSHPHQTCTKPPTRPYSVNVRFCTTASVAQIA